MNLNSEIAFYEELRLVDKARLLNVFLHELAQEARGTYGAGEQVHDAMHLRFVNERWVPEVEAFLEADFVPLNE